MSVYTENPRQRQFLEQLRENERKKVRIERLTLCNWRRIRDGRLGNEHGRNGSVIEPTHL